MLLIIYKEISEFRRYGKSNKLPGRIRPDICLVKLINPGNEKGPPPKSFHPHSITKFSQLVIFED